MDPMRFFRVEMPRAQRIRRRAVYVMSALVLTVMFVYGYVTVYKNSYRIMNGKPMEVWGFYQSESGISVVIMNKRYELFNEHG